MKNLIRLYEESRQAAELRIRQLSEQKKELNKKGDSDSARALDLDRRIRLLYVERRELCDVLATLAIYQRSVEDRGET